MSYYSHNEENMDFDINQKIINDGMGFFSIEDPSIGNPVASTCSLLGNNAGMYSPHIHEDGGGGGGADFTPWDNQKSRWGRD